MLDLPITRVEAWRGGCRRDFGAGRQPAARVCEFAREPDYPEWLALPLVVAGLASARMATVIAVAWLPGAAVQPLALYFIPFSLTRVDAWYLVSWLAWLAIAVLTLSEVRSWRSGNRSQSPKTAAGADTAGPLDA